MARPTKAKGAAPVLELKLQPRQAQAYFCPANEILYGGAAGGGKSHFMRVDAIQCCMEVPGLQAFIFRRNYGDLHLNHMTGATSFPELLAPLINQGYVHIVGEQIRFWNGSVIHLCHLQYTKSLLKYQGAEMHWLGMDELTHFEKKHYDYLRARCRLSKEIKDRVPAHRKSMYPRIVCGTNPGGIGHHWVKEAFVRNGPNRVVRTGKNEGRMRRCYIPAKLADNPALTEADPDYMDRLEGLGDPVLIKAMKEGDWSAVSGAMFGDTWRVSRHVCKPFAIPVDWDIWRGADDGFADPFACYWLTRDPRVGTIYVIREYYGANILPEVAGADIKRIDGEIWRWYDHSQSKERNTAFVTGLLDSAAWGDHGVQAGVTRGKQIVSAGASFRPVQKWPGSRIHGVQNFHRLLAKNKADPRGLPGIIFFNTCVHAIEEIPALPRDPNNPEDVDTKANDHSFDAVRYGLQHITTEITRFRVG